MRKVSPLDLFAPSSETRRLAAEIQPEVLTGKLGMPLGERLKSQIKFF
jgi:hypothetical protein